MGRGRSGASQGRHALDRGEASTPAPGAAAKSAVTAPSSSQGPVRSSARLALGNHARTTAAFPAALQETGGRGTRPGKASGVEAMVSAASTKSLPAEGAPALCRPSSSASLPAVPRTPPTIPAGVATARLPSAPALMTESLQERARPPSPALVRATPTTLAVAEPVAAPVASATLPSAARVGRCAPISAVSPVAQAELPQEPDMPRPTSQAGDGTAPTPTGPPSTAECTQEPEMPRPTLTGGRTTFPSAAPQMFSALPQDDSRWTQMSPAGDGTARPASAHVSGASWQRRSEAVAAAAPAGVETAPSFVMPAETAERQIEAAATAVTSTAGNGIARPPVSPPMVAEWQGHSARVPVAAPAGLGTMFSVAAQHMMPGWQLASTRAPEEAPAAGGRALSSLVRPPVVAMTPLATPSTSVTMMPMNSFSTSAEMMPLSAPPAPAWLPDPSASSSLLSVPRPVSASSLLPPWASAAPLSVTPAFPVAPGKAGPSRAPTRRLSAPPGSARLPVTTDGLTGGGTGAIEASRTTDGSTPETLSGDLNPATSVPAVISNEGAGSHPTALPGSEGSSAAGGLQGAADAVPGAVARADADRANPAPSVPKTTPDVLPDGPRDGVYKLDPTVQANIATLLRVLFAVQDTSDKSCMPFLGVAHYLMAYSYMVDISSIAARELFFDALLSAFERPASMKVFMETAFCTSEHGLHVGGRTREKRHVVGQPDGLRADILRQKLNPGAAKVQWLSRRLRLRTSLDVQVGARSTAGGLTAEDRQAVLTGISQDEVCTKLAERGCTVKYARGAGKSAGPRPIALKFRWDATTTWFPGGLEASLVSRLQHDLLRGTPVALADKETSNRRTPKTGSVAVVVKRADQSNGDADGGARGRKRAKVVKVSPSTDVLGRCRTCGHDESDVVRGTVAPVPGQLEWWSADIAKWGKLPCGGHVLVLSLPVDMDRSAAGRPYVSADIQLNTKEGAPPYRYTVHVKRSPLPAEPSEAVAGASYTSQDGQAPLPHAPSHSFDILRLVRSFLCTRPGPSVAAYGGLPGHTAQQGGELALHVRSVSRRAPLTERIDFVSQYELSTKAELIERNPGRMTILWAGVEPRPMAGASTL